MFYRHERCHARPHDSGRICCACVLALCRCILPVLVLLLLPLAGNSYSLQQPAGKPGMRVLVLDSNARDFPASLLVEQGLHEALAAEPNLALQLSFEYLSLTRFRGKAQRDALVSLLRQRYSGQVDFVIGVGVAAALFLMEYDSLFPGTPVLLNGIPETLGERLRHSALRDRLSCIVEPNSTLHALRDSILRLRPGTRQVYLVSGISESDRVRAGAIRQAFASLADRLQFIDLSGLPLGDILDRCATLPPESVVFFSTLFVDAKGRSFVPKAVLQALSASTSAPVFAQYDQYLGSGIVGGPMFSMRQAGRKMGRVVLDCLQGRFPEQSFLIGADTSSIQYDARQLRRHGIDMRLLPAGATVLFQEISVWDQYRHYFIGVGLLLVLQSALIVGLVGTLRQRQRAQAALYANQQELERLAGRLISSQEEELRRLSREFHDDYAQRLAAMAIETGALELQCQDIGPALPGRIGHIKNRLINLSDDVHALSRELHPRILKDLGLSRALHSLCRHFSDRESCPAICRIDADSDDIPEDIALCVYRVVQEGLRNIAKHAHAQRVDIDIRHTTGRLSVSIADDGAGFDPHRVRHIPGIGLASMRERVQYVRGTFTIQTAPGQGTVIRVTVPLSEEYHHEESADRPGR